MPAEPDQGVRRGRGLPTICQEIFNAEENQFLDGDSVPKPLGFYAFRADMNRGRDRCPACPHLAQRSGRIPAWPYPLSKHFHFIAPYTVKLRLVASYNLPDFSMAMSMARLRSAKPRKARP
jgi:hypothetical protein